MQLVERSPKSRDTHFDPIEKRLAELYGLIYQHYANLAFLYAFAAGAKPLPKNFHFYLHYQRTIEDKRRLLWTSKNLKAQIDTLEAELEALLQLQANHKSQRK